MKNSVNSDRSATRNAPPAFPPPQNRKARILVVDDHPLFRLGLVELINAQSDLAVCGEAGDAARAFEMAGILHPDIVVTDLSLKEVNGLELIKNINASYPRIRAVVLSMHDETLYAERALRAGSYGYMMKEEGAEMVLVAIRRALAGEIFVSDRMKRRLLQGFVGGRTPQAGPALTLLSDRELEVFRLIAAGILPLYLGRERASVLGRGGAGSLFLPLGHAAAGDPGCGRGGPAPSQAGHRGRTVSEATRTTVGPRGPPGRPVSTCNSMRAL